MDTRVGFPGLVRCTSLNRFDELSATGCCCDVLELRVVNTALQEHSRLRGAVGQSEVTIWCFLSLSNQNESDVLKWVVRKEFGELRRCLEVEEAAFMQQVETSAAALISSLQNQTDQLNQNLNRLQEAQNTLRDLNNEGHLGFIVVSF